MSLSFEELELLARQAGFSLDDSPTIAAIALAESGGNPNAHNPRYPDNSYGLMQVNMLDEPGYMLGAERRARYGLQSNEELKDPLVNMRAAKDIFDTQGLGAWSVYKSGAYKNHLPNGFNRLQGNYQPQEQKPQPMQSAVGAVRKAGMPLGDEGPLALAVGNIAKAVYGGEPSDTPQRMAMSKPMPAMASPQSGDGLSIVDLGKQLQGMGFKVAEHPQFGGVGKHSPNSHHYVGNALDLTIQPGSALLAGRPDSDWSNLTSQYGEALKSQFPDAEIFYRDYDPVGGHSEHIHIAFPGGVYRRS